MSPHYVEVAEERPYEILDQVHAKPNFIKIIHVGAGASGLFLAYKAAKMLKNYELICYDKNPVVGGTWFENRYPGCACDIPAHTYTYTFEPNAEWSGFYAGSGEILQYFNRFYEKYMLQQFVKLNTEVVSATWSETEGKWSIELRRNGEIFYDWCHVLMNGSGVVNKWKWPDIQGLHTFKGVLMHSANWDQDLQTSGKDIAVIGTGSSSIQMVSEIAKDAKRLSVFMRNCTWIAPQVGADEQQPVEDGESPAALGKHHYTQKEIEKFKSDPQAFLAYRKGIEKRMTDMFSLFLRDTEVSKAAKAAMTQTMLKRIGPGHEELKQRLIPDWSPGCRRLTPGEGYLEALVQPNVECVWGEIAKITPTGLVMDDGRSYNVDIIACGTGFDISFVPHFKIVGVNGLVMQDEWRGEPNLYLSITAPGFPNYFVFNGPRGQWGQGCSLPFIEIGVEYALQCVRKMQEEGISALEPRQKPTTDFNDHMDAWHKKYSVWNEDCRSWYKNNKIGGRVYIWGGSMPHVLKVLKKPLFEHYDIRYKNDNVFACFGNGRLGIESQPGKDITPWIRNEDTPWDFEEE